MKAQQFANRIQWSTELDRDTDLRWIPERHNSPGIKNFIKRLFKRGGYYVTWKYDPDAPTIRDYLINSILDGGLNKPRVSASELIEEQKILYGDPTEEEPKGKIRGDRDWET